MAISDEDKQEMSALVVGFLQQTLKDNPRGLTLRDFERFFPERAEESVDWYKRYGANTTVEALKMIPEAVRFEFSGVQSTTYITLNMASSLVDTQLVDLIQGQKASTKRGRRGPSRPSAYSSRAMNSFSLNRQYGQPERRTDFRTRLNMEPNRSTNSLFARVSPPRAVMPPRPSIYNKVPASSRMASNDPRNRSASNASMVPPQVKTPSSSTQPSLNQLQTQKTISSSGTPHVPTTPSSLVLNRSSTVPSSNQGFTSPSPRLASKPNEQSQISRAEDPEIDIKKQRLGQRLQSLLTSTFSEIKVAHVKGLYKVSFGDEIEPSLYGHSTWTSLFQDPHLSCYVQLNLKSIPFPTISARKRVSLDSRVTLAFVDQLKDDHGAENSNNRYRKEPVVSAAKVKLDAVDPFNVRSMLQNLEPIGKIKEPTLNNKPIDDVVKYKTMRIIFNSAEKSLKVDEWEIKFEQESRLKIRIRDYGCRTFLEFFQLLEKQLPITIKKDAHDNYIASTAIEDFREWLHEQLVAKNYRAITSLSKDYDLIAFPDMRYTWVNHKDLIKKDSYEPAIILSAKNSSQIWIQLRTSKKIEEHLCVEASLTCYQDYKDRGLNRVPVYFVRPGFPCAVYDVSQNRWCRAVLIDTPDVIDKNYNVIAMLVDYGTIKSVPISELLCLMKTHLQIPVGPINCRLVGINNECDESVQKRAKLVLQEYTSPPVTLACMFVSDSPDGGQPDYLPKRHLNIKLIDTRHGRDFNLTDIMNWPEQETTEQI